MIPFRFKILKRFAVTLQMAATGLLVFAFFAQRTDDAIFMVPVFVFAIFGQVVMETYFAIRNRQTIFEGSSVR